MKSLALHVIPLSSAPPCAAVRTRTNIVVNTGRPRFYVLVHSTVAFQAKQAGHGFHTGCFHLQITSSKPKAPLFHVPVWRRMSAEVDQRDFVPARHC